MKREGLTSIWNIATGTGLNELICIAENELVRTNVKTKTIILPLPFAPCPLPFAICYKISII